MMFRLEEQTSKSSFVHEWVSVKRLNQLERIDPPPAGSEMCAPALHADFKRALTLPVMPSSAEMPAPLGRRVDDALIDDLEAHLRKALVGQKCVLHRLFEHPGVLRLKQRGHWRTNTPVVVLLLGPSGCGKTLSAQLIAEGLLGRPIAELESMGRFKTFHMNQFPLFEDQKTFFGPPSGVMGKRGDLPEMLKKWPDAVILLDEVEKAHSSFAQALLKVFGENGVVYDPYTGKDVPSSRATFILTSNIAKDLIQQLGFDSFQHAGDRNDEEQDECASYTDLRERVLEELQKPRLLDGQINFFKESEIRGRLTDVIPFLPFAQAEVHAAVRKFLAEEARAFSEFSTDGPSSMAWDPAVVPHFASAYSRRSEEGLRGVRNKVHAAVVKALGDAREAGLLQPFGGALLRVEAAAMGSRDVPLDVRAIEPSGFRAATSASASSQSTLGGADGERSGEGAWWSQLMTAPLAALAGSSAPWSGSSDRASLDAASGGGASGGGASDFSWEAQVSWNWQAMWDSMLEWAYEWRWEIAFSFVCVFVAGCFTLAPGQQPLRLPPWRPRWFRWR